MPTNPPANMPRIAPNVFYDDIASALDWLSKSFGFETRMSLPGEDGGIMHAEMDVSMETLAGIGLRAMPWSFADEATRARVDARMRAWRDDVV